MERFLILISLTTSEVWAGHYSYQGTQDTKFSLTVDYSTYADSVAACCFHCNQLSSERFWWIRYQNIPCSVDCKGLMTRFVRDDPADRNRMFECLMTERDE